MFNRHVLTAVTLTVLLVLVGVGAFVGWRTISAPVEEEGEQAAPTCVAGVKRGQKLKSSEVTVSVFNAGNRPGLAARTRTELTGRGFLRGEVGNASGSLSRVRFVRVLAPNRRDPAALLVARQFGPRTFVQATKRNLGPGVDVVVGDDFVGLVKAKRSITARAAGSGC